MFWGGVNMREEQNYMKNIKKTERITLSLGRGGEGCRNITG